MKLSCKVFIHDKTIINTEKSRRTPSKSVLVLRKNDEVNEEIVLTYFSNRNKIGTKYKIEDNVQTISTQLINKGKVTIEFKEPAHDLYITGNVNEVKSFLQLFKLSVEKKTSPKNLLASRMTEQSLAGRDIPVLKLIVSKQSEIPVRGFPKELKQLSVTDIGLPRVPKDILNLTALHTLDLSRNSIEYLPMDLSNLKLFSLNLSGNKFYKSTLTQWNWMDGTLARYLRHLNLSSNKLNYIPENIIKLTFVQRLIFGNNNIKFIPYGILKLRYLKELYLQSNKLRSLPSTMARMELDVMDLRNNEFHRFREKRVTESVPKLLELSAQVARRAKVSYNTDTLPSALVNYLDNPHYCGCGKPCFEQYYTYTFSLLPERLNGIIIPSEERHQIKFECSYCSPECRFISYLR